MLFDLNDFQPKMKEVFVEGDVLSKDWVNENHIDQMKSECHSINQFSKDVNRDIENNLDR